MKRHKKMKKISYFVFSAVMLFSIVSCKDFLEVKPKGYVLPEKLSDYENMLSSPTMTQTFPAELMYCTDDYYGEYAPLDRGTNANMFVWRREIDTDDQVSPAIWGGLYRVIYDANVIIRHVMGAKEGTEQRKKEVLGDALLVRADAYFTLLTVFAKAYDPATAATNPGMPLVTSNDVTESTPPRSSLQATLDTIINNTLQASEYLPQSTTYRFRGTQAAAHGLLARIYLYMGDYTNAAKYSELAVKAPHQLLNYANYDDSFDMPNSDVNPEILWQRASVDYTIPTFLLYSDELMTYFNADDLRFFLLSFSSSKGINRASPPGRANFGVTFPELYLNIAEAAARAGTIGKAMDMVNKIREKRIKASAYQPLSAANPEAALKIVLAERRRELAFSGQRWMDMKRLDKDGRMIEVVRMNKKTGVRLGSLMPGSKEYTFQIPTRVRNFNPKMELN